MKRLLLCTDLDRTLLPNGSAPESAGARKVFGRLVSHQMVKLVYVTGRDPGLVSEAITTWEIPEPDLLIADVGTTIADRANGRWEKWTHWEETIARDWAGRSTEDLKELLSGLAGLTPQDASRQTAFKLSFFTPAGAAGWTSPGTRERLAAAGVQANVIWSVDDAIRKGLARCPADLCHQTSGHRVRHGRVGLRTSARWCFAGDSGNDLDVLVSPIPAVLVANASRLRCARRSRHRPSAKAPPCTVLAVGPWV